MSIRRTATPPQITPDDLQFAIRGRTFGVEITDVGDYRALTFLEQRDGAWAGPVGTRTNISLEIEGDAVIDASGGARVWLRTKFLPWANALLAELFPAAGVAAEPLPDSAIEQIDRLIGSMFAAVAAPDGTVQLVERT